MPYRRLDQEPDVEGHAGRFKFRDADGNEFDIPEDRIISVTTQDGEEVEGHLARAKVLSQEPDAEGHAAKFKYRDQNGQEQEVEGHMFHGFSDLRLKRDVEPLRDALTRLAKIG